MGDTEKLVSVIPERLEIEADGPEGWISIANGCGVSVSFRAVASNPAFFKVRPKTAVLEPHSALRVKVQARGQTRGVPQSEKIGFLFFYGDSWSSKEEFRRCVRVDFKTETSQNSLPKTLTVEIEEALSILNRSFKTVGTGNFVALLMAILALWLVMHILEASLK